MVYVCIICNRNCKIVDNKLQFIDIEVDSKIKLKFCCDLCQKTDSGKKYLKLKNIKKSIYANIFYIVLSIIGIIIYILILMSLVK